MPSNAKEMSWWRINSRLAWGSLTVQCCVKGSSVCCVTKKHNILVLFVVTASCRTPGLGLMHARQALTHWANLSPVTFLKKKKKNYLVTEKRRVVACGWEDMCWEKGQRDTRELWNGCAPEAVLMVWSKQMCMQLYRLCLCKKTRNPRETWWADQCHAQSRVSHYCFLKWRGTSGTDFYL